MKFGGVTKIKHNHIYIYIYIYIYMTNGLNNLRWMNFYKNFH